VIVAVVPVPVSVAPVGLDVTVQVPVEGNPERATLLVDIVHPGWVTAPGTGAVGIATIMTVVVEVTALHDPEAAKV
jgi:hypothetical protein